MRHVPVIIFGAGGVGRALLRQIVAGRDVTRRRNKVHFDVVAVTDSRGWRWEKAGLNDSQLEKIVADKGGGRALGADRPGNLDILDQAEADGLEDVLVVDVTAEKGMEAVVDRALAMGYGVALANKKPLTGPWDFAGKYFDHPRIRYESTVGGGQPVIAALRYLMDTNDPISGIEGQLSGTLGYICGRLDEGTPFSLALSEAKEQGITEPDPREDLGGLDVMRKIMILGRLAGWPLEEADIRVESLYDATWVDLSVLEFMELVPTMDMAIKRRVSEAAANGAVLRYEAKVEAGRGSVGLTPISKDNPLAHLKYIGFKSGRYRQQPLMIGGKGAGLEMTAAGVVGDLISLARERPAVSMAGP